MPVDRLRHARARVPHAIGVRDKNIVIGGALALSLLILPVIIIATREAIRAVPREIRDGSLALGATQWQTTWRQVLPAAVPGIATGSILALSRALGEAAPLLLLGALVFVSFDPNGLLSGYTTMPIQIFNWTGRPQEGFHELAAATSILLLVLLLLDERRGHLHPQPIPEAVVTHDGPAHTTTADPMHLHPSAHCRPVSVRP